MSNFLRRPFHLKDDMHQRPTYLPSYLPTYLLTYLPSYLPTYLLTYLPIVVKHSNLFAHRFHVPVVRR